MKIGVLTSQPDHPLLVEMAALLVADHEVVWLDPVGASAVVAGSGSGVSGGVGVADACVVSSGLADVYVLKDRSDEALAWARWVEECGVPVVNSAAATARCQDRVVMGELARGAGLPFAGTWPAGRLGGLAREGLGGLGVDFPVVVKSRRSRRHDVVARVDDWAQLRLLGAAWADEPVVVQPFTANSGWDYKMWVICGRVFAGLRRSELAGGQGRGVTLPLAREEIPPGWLELVRGVGSVFSLDVYGVDVVDAGGGVPLIVDVNAFPGIRGQLGAAEALAQFVVRVGAGGVAAVSGSSL